uniref:Uncharacterized protein n=1 Tax=Parascaris univalens TaxID=6257 RepID=A0A915BLX8_PARUN
MLNRFKQSLNSAPCPPPWNLFANILFLDLFLSGRIRLLKIFPTSSLTGSYWQFRFPSSGVVLPYLYCRRNDGLKRADLGELLMKGNSRSTFRSLVIYEWVLRAFNGTCLL